MVSPSGPSPLVGPFPPLTPPAPGGATGFLSIAWALTKLGSEDAHILATAASLGCGILYPWNAKLGYLSPGLPVKYPMHYVPEVLVLALAVANALAF